MLVLENKYFCIGKLRNNLLQRKIRTHLAVGSYYSLVAESEGFEPSERFPVHTISNRAPSTTQPTLYVLLSLTR